MGEGLSHEVLTVNSRPKTGSAAVEIEPADPKDPPAQQIERPPHGKYDKPVPIANTTALRTAVVRDLRELETFSCAWKALAKNAADPNVCYEPWWLLPSLRYLHAGRNVLFLLMFTADPDCPTGPELLCGIFPFEVAPRYRGLPTRVLRLLRPTYNRLCTPLVHSEFVEKCVGALLDWAEHNPEHAPLIEFRFITGEGRVAQELHQQISDRRWVVFQSDCTIRALFKPVPDTELYLERALRGKHRKELRRLENRLSDLGPTQYRRLNPGDDARPWIAAFLELESSGWKGQRGSALASREDTRRFFEECALEAHRHGQLMMLGLFHKDRPIALKCNFCSGNGSFAFKIAFDEDYARFSPGVLVEIENLRRLHEMPGVAWMDSTAESQHFMINRLWMDRRTIETLVLSPNRAWGNFIVSGFPFLRWIKGAVHHTLPRANPGKKTQGAN